jgi:hypothetical protein
MRRIIVSDVRFQILCKSCMVLIKTPIIAINNLKLAKNAMISGNGLSQEGEEKAQCCFT